MFILEWKNDCKKNELIRRLVSDPGNERLFARKNENDNPRNCYMSVKLEPLKNN